MTNIIEQSNEIIEKIKEDKLKLDELRGLV
jgi:hypothetical protein